ncbi:hypothetical protein [Thiomicrorhabdus sp. Kp2]|uniref:hypothetical protein n=1 Tax=Thiomicrorhabdus sp. Kp2 TaxID=1123518 RepID=UPI000424D018|nr:hypothetical protein [Thiomicrorhabdus sp. Kp2]
MDSHLNFKPGVYEVTHGDYQGAAIFLIEVSEPEESEFVYMTIFNPGSEESHEISFDEWVVMVDEDGLIWRSEIPDEIKDMYLEGSFSTIDNLN